MAPSDGRPSNFDKIHQLVLAKVPLASKRDLELALQSVRAREGSFQGMKKNQIVSLVVKELSSRESNSTEVPENPAQNNMRRIDEINERIDENNNGNADSVQNTHANVCLSNGSSDSPPSDERHGIDHIDLVAEPNVDDQLESSPFESRVLVRDIVQMIVHRNTDLSVGHWEVVSIIRELYSINGCTFDTPGMDYAFLVKSAEKLIRVNRGFREKIADVTQLDNRNSIRSTRLETCPTNSHSREVRSGSICSSNGSFQTSGVESSSPRESSSIHDSRDPPDLSGPPPGFSTEIPDEAPVRNPVSIIDKFNAVKAKKPEPNFEVLPVLKGRKQESNPSKKECALCASSLIRGSGPKQTLACGHSYHSSCMRQKPTGCPEKCPDKVAKSNNTSSQAVKSDPSKTAWKPLSTTSDFEGQNETHCAICFEELNFGNPLSLVCKHRFHTYCLTNWFKKGKERSCPICRKLAVLPSEFPSLSTSS